MSTRRDAEARLIDAATGHAFIETDDDGVVVVFSRGAEILLGYPRAEMLGRNVSRILDDSTQVRTELADHPDAADPDTGTPAPREWTLRRRDGVLVPAMVVVTRSPGVAGGPPGHLFVATDMTGLLGRIGHDLRSPLTSVLGYAQLLDTDLLTDEQHRYVDAIERNGRRLLHLIDELQAGKR
jgi:PAS domain S-box-containing protein